jgi:hypothetical protein
MFYVNAPRSVTYCFHHGRSEIGSTRSNGGGFSSDSWCVSSTPSRNKYRTHLSAESRYWYDSCCTVESWLWRIAAYTPLTVDSSAAVRDRQQPTRPNPHDGIESSIVIPGHEEPIDDNTCAICLDAFLDGELVNHSSTECKHIFHKDCLLGWLDQHDVCPCRSIMVTEKDWKRAMDVELPVIQEHGSRTVGQHH